MSDAEVVCIESKEGSDAEIEKHLITYFDSGKIYQVYDNASSNETSCNN